MRRLLPILAVLALAILPGQATAFERESSLRSLHPQTQHTTEYRTLQSRGKTLDEAIAEVRRRTGGKIIDARTRVQGNREVHHIKVLHKDGKVKTHKVNGRSR